MPRSEVVLHESDPGCFHILVDDVWIEEKVGRGGSELDSSLEVAEDASLGNI